LTEPYEENGVKFYKKLIVEDYYQLDIENKLSKAEDQP
jgi:hypothetical protein